jgi:AcrR family transcriptional regulator
MRKLPQQARSKAMVERIIRAAREVLVEDGYDALSTNRVAAAAGVSPGSLYQYFPDKTAILDVVVDRYWDGIADRVVASLGDRLGEFGPGAARATADALVSALEADRALIRVMYEELPQRRLREKLTSLERRVRELATAVLAAQPGGRRDAGVRAWIVVMAIENLAARWVLDQPDIPRERLLDEMAGLVVRYLGPDRH